MNTHTFKLVSGPLCEVTEFTGKQQEILTQSNKKQDKTISKASRTDILIASLLVAVGSERLEHWSEDKKLAFVQKMLGFDKQKLLIEARQFSLDFDPDFTFKYTWLDDAGDKQVDDINVILPYDQDNFPQQTMKIEIDGELVDADFTEYSEVLENTKVNLTLPKSGLEISYYMLDGTGEAIMRGIKEADRTINTLLEARRPVKYVEGTAISLNLSTLSMKDLAVLRTSIKEREGAVDTVIMFEHPDKDNKFGAEKNVELDILGINAFFFQTEVH